MKGTFLLPVALPEDNSSPMIKKKVPGRSAFSKNSICLGTLVASKHSFSHRLRVATLGSSRLNISTLALAFVFLLQPNKLMS